MPLTARPMARSALQVSELLGIDKTSLKSSHRYTYLASRPEHVVSAIQSPCCVCHHGALGPFSADKMSAVQKYQQSKTGSMSSSDIMIHRRLQRNIIILEHNQSHARLDRDHQTRTDLAYSSVLSQSLVLTVTASMMLKSRRKM